MKTTVSADVKNDPVLRELVEQAHQILAAEIGESKGSPVVSWGLVRNEFDRPLIELKLTAYDAAAEKTISMNELTDTRRLPYVLNHFWRDLLTVSIRHSVARIGELADEIAVEEETLAVPAESR